MIEMTIAQIAEVVAGEIFGIDPSEKVTQIPVIDSRLVDSSTFFVAFKGENFDGHSFAAQAVESGAQFVLASSKVDVPSIVVRDTAKALARLAAYVRNELSDLVVIGITGSQGKTTTKDLLRHLLSISAPTIAPFGNLNNELGVPLTLLRCERKGVI